MPCRDETSDQASPPGVAAYQRVLLPLLVLVFTVSGTLMMWRFACESDDARARMEAEHTVLGLTNSVRERFDDCRRVLQAGRVLVRCSERVSRDEWALFVAMMDLPNLLPGVNGVAFVRAVTDEDLPAYIERARSEIVPDFELRAPPGCRISDGLHEVIEYHEPASRNASLWGLDVAANPVNRVAYDESMVTGQMRATGIIDLAQKDSSGNPLRGMVLAVPVYRGGVVPETRADRRESIVGWVAMSIDVETFFDQWWDGADFSGGCVVTDTDAIGDRRVVFDAPGPGGERTGTNILTLPLAVGGRSWELAVFSPGPLEVDHTRANMTLLLGLVISILLTGVIWSLSNTRYRTLKVARKMTEHLRHSEERQRELALRAEQASRMKSLFLANMSHDVRTPMTAILGYSRLLEQELGDHASPLAVEALSAIRRSGDHLLGLINDVLDLSKIEAGRLTLSPETIDTADLIAGCRGIIQPQAETKGVELRVGFITPVPAKLSADPTRLRQIMLNLLGNAVKFTASGRVTLSVWTGENGDFCFEVRDTGIGMSREDLDRVFEPFVQADPSHTRRFGGTGLGLTIVRHLVERMGGRIEVDSILGAGTRFTIRLPLEQVGDEMIDSIPDPGGACARIDEPVQSDPRRAPCRVLVAEDGPDNQRLIAHVLAKGGYPFEIVDNGRDAIESFEKARAEGQPYDVVLLDMQLPEVDGYGVARTLRIRGTHAVIIALTAHAMTGDREKCIAAGCDGYIAKPFDPLSLLDEIERLRPHRHAA